MGKNNQEAKALKKANSATNAKTEKPVSKHGATVVETQAKTEKLKQKNMAAAVEEIQGGRKSKYIYPEGCITGEQKKSFRKTTRNTLKKLEDKLKELQANPTPKNKKELSQIEKRITEFHQEVYMPSDN